MEQNIQTEQHDKTENSVVVEQKSNKKHDFKTLFSLFITFFKIGLFTFGGGYAMISLISKEASEKHGWVSDDEILEIVAIAESTPGPISVNSATFIGYKVGGFFGSFFATFGLVLPSFIIISLLSLILNEFSSLKAVQYAFMGIRAGVLALVLKGFVSMAKKCPKKWISYLVASLVFIVSVFIDVNSIYLLIASAVIGLVYSLIAERRSKNA